MKKEVSKPAKKEVKKVIQKRQHSENSSRCGYISISFGVGITIFVFVTQANINS